MPKRQTPTPDYISAMRARLTDLRIEERKVDEVIARAEASGMDAYLGWRDDVRGTWIYPTAILVRARACLNHKLATILLSAARRRPDDVGVAYDLARTASAIYAIVSEIARRPEESDHA